MNIAVTNVLTGQFRTFSEHHSNKILIKILQASVSFLGISNPIYFHNSIFTSGSAVYENDVMAAINHCEMLGYAEKDIIIDSVLGGSTRLANFDTKKKNSFQIMSRSSELWKYYESIRGVMRAKNGHTGVNFRYLIGPQFNMPTKMLPIAFTLDETK